MLELNTVVCPHQSAEYFKKRLANLCDDIDTALARYGARVVGGKMLQGGEIELSVRISIIEQKGGENDA